MTPAMLRLAGALIASTMLSGAPGALAQSLSEPDAKTIALCAGITSDLKRLSC